MLGAGEETRRTAAPSSSSAGKRAGSYFSSPSRGSASRQRLDQIAGSARRGDQSANYSNDSAEHLADSIAAKCLAYGCVAARYEREAAHGDNIRREARSRSHEPVW